MFAGWGTQQRPQNEQPQPEQQQIQPSQPRQRSRIFGVVTQPMRFLGATANGVSAVVQKPVRAARRARSLRGAVTSDDSEPEPEPIAEPERKRAPWDGLIDSMKDSIEGAKELIPRGEATSQQLLKRCFPARLSHSGGSGAAAFTGTVHDLAASGTRVFGLSVGRAKLQVKIYDFALYFDAKQAKHSQLGRSRDWTAAPQLASSQQTQPAHSPTASPQQQASFANSLRSSSDIDMSLVVRASRNLPLRLMMGEYERILKRRLKQVGGSPEDPALTTVLESFREEHLPPAMVRGGNVVKDSVLTFTKAPGGRVSAVADGKELATVTSPAFAAAIFDLYIGDQPVSGDARSTALDAAARMMAGGNDVYSPAPGQQGICDGVGAGTSGDGCRRQRWRAPWDRRFAPQMA